MSFKWIDIPITSNVSVSLKRKTGGFVDSTDAFTDR